jgi:TRAP-type mannitol/chloroaromatic compound transport system permease small subunit
LNSLLKVSRIIDWTTTKIGQATWWLTLFMVAVGVINVVTRYVGRAIGMRLGGTIYIALQTYAFDMIFLLGAAYLLRVDGHVRIDLIYSNVSRRTRAWIDIFGTLVFLFPLCYMGIVLSRPYVANSWRQLEINRNAGNIPVYPIKTMIIVAFALLAIQGISELIKNAAFLSGHPNSGSIHAKEPVAEVDGGVTNKIDAI